MPCCATHLVSKNVHPDGDPAPPPTFCGTEVKGNALVLNLRGFSAEIKSFQLLVLALLGLGLGLG